MARLEPMAASVAQPIVLLLRWLAGSAAVSGAFHAVSAATPTSTITSENPVNGTNGVSLAYRVEIKLSNTDKIESYTAQGIPPGLTFSKTVRTFQGIPTSSGHFVTQVISWEGKNGTGHSAINELVFNIVGKSPVITSPPKNLAVNLGDKAEFTVAATGEAPLTYRWLKEDIELATTTTNLTFASTSAANAGRYRVRVTSPGGVTLSDFATLTVVSSLPPTITTQPTNRSVNAGDSVTFTVGAAGDGPLTFAWLKDSVEIGGNATNQTLTLAPTSATDNGTYRVRISNRGGSTLSDPATLTVNAVIPTPKIVSQSTNLNLHAGETAHLLITLGSSSTVVAPTISWQHNGASIPNEFGTRIGLTNVTAEASGSYVATVNGPGGTTVSNPIIVTVTDPVSLRQPVANPDHIRLSYTSTPGREYLLEGNTLDAAEGWRILQTLSPLTTTGETLELFGTAVYRFFRLRVVPLP